MASRSNPQGNTIIVSEFPIFAPVLVQITVVHEPSLKFLQFATHLTPLLCKAPSLCPLLFSELPVLGSSLREARKAVLGPSFLQCLRLSGACSAQRQLGRPLARRAFERLGIAPLTRPIRAKTPWDTL